MIYFLDPFDNIDLYFKWIQFQGILYIILTIATTILLGIGIYLMMRDERYGGKNQKKNLKWSFIFFWIIVFLTVLYWVLPRFIISYNYDDYVRYSVIRTIMYGTLGMTSMFCYAMALILPVWRLSNKRAKDLIFIYFIVYLFVALPFEILIFTIFSPFLKLAFIYSIFITFFNIAIMVTARIILIYVYSKAIRISEKREKVHEKAIISERFLFRGRFPVLIKKPIHSLIVFSVAGLMMGSLSGLFFYIRLEKDDHRDIQYFENVGDEMVNITEQTSGHLQEGEEEIHVHGIDGNVVSIDVTLIWRDESDRRLTENTPDTFTLTTDLEGPMDQDPQTSTGENPHGGSGSLKCSYSFDREDR